MELRLHLRSNDFEGAGIVWGEHCLPAHSEALSLLSVVGMIFVSELCSPFQDTKPSDAGSHSWSRFLLEQRLQLGSFVSIEWKHCLLPWPLKLFLFLFLFWGDLEFFASIVWLRHVELCSLLLKQCLRGSGGSRPARSFPFEATSSAMVHCLHCFGSIVFCWWMVVLLGFHQHCLIMNLPAMSGSSLPT